MNPWTTLVHAIERAIGGTADLLGGSLGAGIFGLTLIVRLALIPIMLPLARRARAWRAIHRTLRPEIKALNVEYKQDPSALQRELKSLHRRHGIGVVDTAGLYGALIQVPILIAFFQAVLHLSPDTPLASGGLLPGIAAGVVSFAAAVLGDASTPRPVLYMAGLLPVAIAAWLGSGVGLYLIAFYLGTLVQSLLLRRSEPVVATAPDGDTVA